MNVPTIEVYKGRTIRGMYIGEMATALSGGLQSKRFQGRSGMRRAMSHVKRQIDQHEAKRNR